MNEERGQTCPTRARGALLANLAFALVAIGFTGCSSTDDPGGDTDAADTSDGGAGADADTGAGADADTGADTGADADASVDADAAADTDAGVDSAGEDADAGTDTDAGTDADAGTDTDAGAEATIGPEGGTVASADGLLTLEIPAGALDAAVAITVSPVTDVSTLPGADVNAYHARAWALAPDGLTFAVPVAVTLLADRAELELPGRDDIVYAVDLWNLADAAELADGIETVWTDDAVVVRGDISHFSSVATTRGGMSLSYRADQVRLQTVGSQRGTGADLFGEGGSTLAEPSLVTTGEASIETSSRERSADPFLARYIITERCVSEGLGTISVVASALVTPGAGGPARPTVVGREAQTRCVPRADTAVGSSGASDPLIAFTPDAREMGVVEEIDGVRVINVYRVNGDISGDYRLVGTFDVPNGMTGFTLSSRDTDQFAVDYIVAGATPEDNTAVHDETLLEDPVDFTRDLLPTELHPDEVRPTVGPSGTYAPTVGVVAGESLYHVRPNPLFSWGATNLAGVAGSIGPITDVGSLFYLPPGLCDGPDCPASGVNAGIAGSSSGQVQWVTGLGFGGTVDASGPIAGLRCVDNRTCVTVSPPTDGGDTGAIDVFDIDVWRPGGIERALGPFSPEFAGEVRRIEAINLGTRYIGVLASLPEHFLLYLIDRSTDDGVPTDIDEHLDIPAPEGCDVVGGALDASGSIWVTCDGGDIVRIPALQLEPEGPAPSCAVDTDAVDVPEAGLPETRRTIAAGATHRFSLSPATYERAYAVTLARRIDEEGPGIGFRGPDGGTTWLRAQPATSQTLTRTLRVPAGSAASFEILGGSPGIRDDDRCGSYDLSLLPAVARPDAGEPNDTAATASALAAGSARAGALDVGDIDLYLLDVDTRPQCHVQIDDEAIRPFVDWELEIDCNSAGKSLGSGCMVALRNAGPPFDYTLFCGPPTGTAEACANAMDDDGDGLADCDDPDCHWESGCARLREVCTNGLDDDMDGLRDCADPDCLGPGANCVDAPLEDCGNGVDDDGDRRADCDDLYCALDPVCGPARESCTNGVDDDGDGDIDCDDADCAEDVACGPARESCTNGVDDDGDGDIDCDDADCADDIACLCGDLTITTVRFGTLLELFSGALCLYDECAVPIDLEPIFDRVSYDADAAINAYAGDFVAPFVRASVSVPSAGTFEVRRFLSGDMHLEFGRVGCELDVPSASVDVTSPDLSGLANPLVLLGGVRSRTPGAYVPADDCYDQPGSACPPERTAMVHAYDTDCTGLAGVARVRVINLSPNQAAITLTEENELVSPEATVVSNLAYGEASDYIEFSAEDTWIQRVWRVYDAADPAVAIGTVNGAFNVASGSSVMEVPQSGTCTTIVVTVQAGVAFSQPAILVADDPVVCTGWRNLSAIDPVRAPCE